MNPVQRIQRQKQSVKGQAAPDICDQRNLLELRFRRHAELRKLRDQILRQEYDYGLLDPELDRVSSQSPDTEAPYGAFDLIETSPDEVGGP